MPITYPAIVTEAPLPFKELASAMDELLKAIKASTAQQNADNQQLTPLRVVAELQWSSFISLQENGLLHSLWSDYVRATQHSKATAYSIHELEAQAKCATPFIQFLTKTIQNPISMQEETYQKELEQLGQAIEANYKQDATGRKYQRLQRFVAIVMWTLFISGFILAAIMLGIAPPLSLIASIGVTLAPFLGGLFGAVGVGAASNKIWHKMPYYHSKNLFTFYQVNCARLTSDLPQYKQHASKNRGAVT